MMLRRTILAIATAVAMAGCATTMPAPDDTPLDATIVMQRSVCFGACPDYRVEIGGDGSVHYTGGRFVRVQGEQRAQIEPSAVRALVARFEAAHFFDLRDAYRAQVTDLPTTTLTLTLNGRTKTVVDYGGAMIDMPASVTALQDGVDETSGAARWVQRQ